MTFLDGVGISPNTGESVFNLVHPVGQDLSASTLKCTELFYRQQPQVVPHNLPSFFILSSRDADSISKIEDRWMLEDILYEISDRAVDLVENNKLSQDSIAKIVQMLGHNPQKLGSKHIILHQKSWAQEILPQVAALPQFEGVLNGDTRDPLNALGRIVDFAKTQMTDEHYAAIRSQYPNPVCAPFFQDLADQIYMHANRDKVHATLVLAEALGFNAEGDSERKTFELAKAFLREPELIASVTELNLSESNLTVLPDELRLFTNLTHLDLGWNQLTELDVSNLTALTDLSLERNQLTEIDVSNLTALTHLNLGSNELTELDVSNLTALTDLSLGWNQLTEIDVSNLTELTYLYLGWNQLTAIDVSNLTALTRLYLESNQLAELDVSNLTALTNLHLRGNQLIRVDISNLLVLTDLNLSGNRLTEVTLLNLPALTYLILRHNRLTQVDVTALTQLEYLHLLGNPLTPAARAAITELAIPSLHL